MSSVTIAESFDRPLPPIPCIQHSGNAHISGPSTSNAEAPSFAFSVPFNTWDQYADQVLRRSSLSGHALASYETTRQLRLEADVADAAAVHLINPIDMAISSYRPGSVISLNQHTVGTARTDKCWLFNGSEEVPFAVLDYKRPGIIREKEFAKAFVLPQHTGTYSRRVTQMRRRCFVGNSETLLKQAVNYSDQYQTKYVALFDWQCLLLLVLEQREGFNGGL
ncbi:fic DOC family [Fusarium albosuccineum]|uniref:Fic DOC family n=1 Tax=Fusarium albosuccineum TaxID=1237068 RepID=A0A8H4L1Y1_9HYPO|nr:fic DOC family [Fusarium albosuccineum]